jgi:hypothetical protein
MKRDIQRGWKYFPEITSGGNLPLMSTIEFIEAAVERMFNADEVSSVVNLGKLKELNQRIVQLFLYANGTGRNYRN